MIILYFRIQQSWPPTFCYSVCVCKKICYIHKIANNARLGHLTMQLSHLFVAVTIDFGLDLVDRSSENHFVFGSSPHLGFMLLHLLVALLVMLHLWSTGRIQHHIFDAKKKDYRLCIFGE